MYATFKKILTIQSFIGVFAIALSLFACSNSEMASANYPGPTQPSNSSIINLYSLEGMVPVFSDGKKISLGTNSKSAASNARPQMNVLFTYDYFISQHEVTCKEFQQFNSIICREPNKPLTSKTFFDAVLYANERSKAEHFDTAYTYSSAEFDNVGRCINLIGFAFHPETNAYRLPTEAEWVYAASQNWNPNNGWNLSNSESELHDVCTAKDIKKDSTFCDMAGNAMEWVNDWLGNFKDTTITNFVGAPDGESFGQRVVKGGSIRNSADAMKLYNRGDVYAITSSTTSNAIGFRLAFGSIPDAVWMGSNGSAITTRIIPHATSPTIRKITGSYKTKLAFRNDLTGNLVYIDYYNGSLSVEEIPDKISSYHPDISPNGKHVAFCTGLEGINSNSAVYVRDLDPKGSNLVKLDVENAAIPRWQVKKNGDTVITYVSSAQNNRDETQFKQESTWEVPFSNGKFGKPQKLFDGAFHGGISINRKFAITGSQLLRAHINSKDTIWYNGEQACNASLANDQSKRTLFLDFGGHTGREFVGKAYQTHQQILIVDSTGKLIQNISAPEGYEFDHTEWAKQVGVSRDNLIVATLNNAEGAHRKIVLVDLNDNNIIPLAEGDELWHPSFWVSEHSELPQSSILDYDSAGIYLSETHNSVGMYQRVKMEVLWKNIQDMEVLLIGGSRVEHGLLAGRFLDKKMVNMGVQGIDLRRDKFFIEKYAFITAPKTKAVVISLDLDHWGIDEDFLSLILDSGPGYYYDSNHDYWPDSIPDGLIQAVENAFPAEIGVSQKYTSLGDFCEIPQGWSKGHVEFSRDSTFEKEQQKKHKINLQLIQKLIEDAAQRKIFLIGIIFPQDPKYQKTGAFGRYGLKRSIAQEDIKWLSSLAKKNPYFILMDENKMGKHDYTDEMAFDQDHLSCAGAEQLTQRLNDLLDSLYKK